MSTMRFPRRWLFLAALHALLPVVVAASLILPSKLFPAAPSVPAPWEQMRITPHTRCWPPGTLGVPLVCPDHLMDKGTSA